MTNAELSQALQADELSTQQAAPQPTQNIFFRMLRIMLAIGLLFLGLVMLLYVISKFSDTVAIVNQTIYHTKYLSTQAKLNLFEYFLSRITLSVSSLLLMASGVFFIVKRPKAGRLLLLGIALLGIQFIITIVIGVRELHENTKAEEVFSEKVDTVNRATITDMTVIWKLKDPQLCKNITEYYARKNCVTEMGDEFFTLDFCDDIEGNDKNHCMWDVAKAQKNRQICDDMQDPLQRTYCLVGIAPVLKDEKICNEVTNNNTLRSTCIANVGIALGDPSYCERVYSSISKNNCYSNIAANTQNRSLCEKISDQQYRESCIHTVEVQSK